MPTLPPDIMACLSLFAPVFSRRVWRYALVLVVGAILAPGPRMVSSVLRVMDLSHLRWFQRYHRVLNRDVWNSLELGRILLRLLIASRWYGEPDRPVEILSGTALWYHTGLPPVPIRWVLVRDPNGVFQTQALLCTDPDATPAQILAWFVLRWQVEVTFHETRQHLGVGTRRHWSDRAIVRTTPALMGLFSLVTLLAHPSMEHTSSPVRSATWYTKPTPTFIDALAMVRRSLWTQTTFQRSPTEPDLIKMPRPLAERLTEILSYAA